MHLAVLNILLSPPFQVDVIPRFFTVATIYATRLHPSLHALCKYAAKALADRRELGVAVMVSTGALGSVLHNLSFFFF